MWMLDGKGNVTLIHMAREPDWQITNWSDPMQNWYRSHGLSIEAMRANRAEVDPSGASLEDPDFFADALKWGEYRGNMGTLAVTEIDYDSTTKALRIQKQDCRYYVENAPAFLDEPGEFYAPSQGEHRGVVFARLPYDRDPSESVIEASRVFVPIEIPNQSHIHIRGLRFSFDDAGPWWYRNHYPRRKHFPTTVKIIGHCRDIHITHNRFLHVNGVVIGQGRFATPEANERYFSDDEAGSRATFWTAAGAAASSRSAVRVRTTAGSSL
jgi:hypothetical protein